MRNDSALVIFAIARTLIFFRFHAVQKSSENKNTQSNMIYILCPKGLATATIFEFIE